jgi:hypothetical protein
MPWLACLGARSAATTPEVLLSDHTVMRTLNSAVFRMCLFCLCYTKSVSVCCACSHLHNTNLQARLDTYNVHTQPFLCTLTSMCVCANKRAPRQYTLPSKMHARPKRKKICTLCYVREGCYTLTLEYARASVIREMRVYVSQDTDSSQGIMNHSRDVVFRAPGQASTDSSRVVDREM